MIGSSWWAGRSCRCHRRDAVTKRSGKHSHSDFARAAPEGVFVASESQFNLAEDTFVIPDVLVRPAAIRTPDLRGEDALLVVEVAETSLAYDRGMKARLFASHGVREYWVINAVTLVTAVHTGPSATGYTEIKEFGPR